MAESDIMKEYRQRLPALFKQILMMFKDAPTNNSWVLEKLMEVFCRDIAHNQDLVKEVDFSSFLNGFLEADSVIQYPDFVMNNVSLMAAEVLSAQDDSSFLEAPAFFIIRSPLQFWMVTKGHRVDVTFQIYKKWVRKRSMLHLLDGVQFDVTHALVHCLASQHNYTRHSAGDYFLELIKFTHNEHQEEADDEVLCDIKSRLKSTVSHLTNHFSSVFIKSAEVFQYRSSEIENCTLHEKSFSYYKHAAVNYCRLLSQCTVISSAWCRTYSETDMFDQLVALLQIIATDNDVDKCDLFRPSTAMLIKFINYSSSATQNVKVKKLIKLLIQVSGIRNYSICSDAVYMAGLILTELNIEVQDQMLLVELSLLPLFVLFDVIPQSVFSSCPSAIEIVKSFLKSEQKSKPSALLKVAVDNLSSIDDVQINKTPYGTFIDYLKLKRMDPPIEVGLSLVNGDNIRNEKFLNFLVLKLTKVNLAFNQANDDKCLLDNVQVYTVLENVQAYTKLCLSHPSISSGHLYVVMDCYLTVLKLLKNVGPLKNKILKPTAEDTDCVYNRHILQIVLQALQFKMFDIEPNVREVAVKAVGQMFLIVLDISLTPEVSMDMCASLSTLWQCVDNKTEGVAMKVLEFLMEAAESGHQEMLFSFMNITKADVITRLDKFLLSSPWDDIKVVAFNLLTRVISRDLLVRYAEACLRQDNARLALVVLDYIQDIFIPQQDNNFTLEQKVDIVTSLFIQGWGDLLLQKANAADVCSFRKASCIMAKILDFMKQTDVCAIIDKRVSYHYQKIGIPLNKDCEKLHTYFEKMCDNILKIHGHIDISIQKLTSKLVDHQGHINLGTENIKPHEFRQLTTTKRDFEMSNDDRDIQIYNIQGCESTVKDRLSHICLFCTLIDAEKISYAKEQKQCVHNIDYVSERKQTSEKNECYCGSAESKMVPSEDYDFYLDSTKEMPALTLRIQPFASQEHIQGILSHSNKCLDSTNLISATGLLSWLVFQEMFKRVDPEILQEEAQCSTDEYERNSLTLFFDLDQLVARNFHSLQKKLEQELIMYFFSSFSKILNIAVNTADSKVRGEFLKEIINNMYITKLVQQEEENVINFILQKRRSILKTPFENSKSQFVLDQFLDRLNFLNCHGSNGYITELYTSAEGLEALLQLYVNERTEGNIAHYYLMKSDASGKYADRNTANEIDTVVNSVINILSNLCGEGCKSEIKESLVTLPGGEMYFLSSVLERQFEDFETTQEQLKTLLTSSSLEMFQPVLQLLQSLTKQLILVSCDTDDQVKLERYSKVAACFGQLENWFLAEDDEFDSEGEDDPTAIDCF